MARYEYELGDVKYAIQGKIPVSEVNRRLPRVKMKGEVFHKAYENSSSISPTSTWNVPITESDLKGRSYFNRLIVHNLSECDIDVRFNASTTKKTTVLSHTSAVFGKTDNKKFWLLVIYNRSTTTSINANEIIVEVSKVND